MLSLHGDWNLQQLLVVKITKNIEIKENEIFIWLLNRILVYYERKHNRMKNKDKYWNNKIRTQWILRGSVYNLCL
jgi:phage antirepressor YoqD-like protein